MTGTKQLDGNNSLPHGGPRRGGTPRRRRWLLRSAGIIATIIVIIAGAVVAYIKLGPSARPLTLPASAAHAPVGPLSGTWQVASGSKAGFRVRETALGASNYAGGITKAISGTIIISRDSVTAATLRVNLAAINVGGHTQPQFVASLATRRYPLATFTLTRPTPLRPAFAHGRTVTLSAIGELTMHGSTRSVTVTLTARRDGPELQAAGSIPITFAPWHIAQPTGFGFLGSLASRGTAEFIVILHRK
jgi:polyisoprenoid-binding protein YceI